MVHRDELIRYLDTYLNITDFRDYSPNGLQVEGKEKVQTVVTGVSANVTMFEKAIRMEADMIIVHHGIFWDKESRVVRGGLKTRLQRLLDNNITLLAYHLPLDKHPVVGNNAQAALALGLTEVEPFGDVGIKGKLDNVPFEKLLGQVQELYTHDPMVFPYGPELVNSIGICSGGAPYDIDRAIYEGLDVYMTGEVAEPIMHKAKEGNIHFMAAGHYATERLGIMALGDHITDQFEVNVRYIDVHNPV